MAIDGIDIRLFGDRELERKLERFERKVQRKMIARVFRDHLEVIRDRIVRNLSGNPVHPDSGRLRNAMRSARKRAVSRRPRQMIRIGIAWPTRAELGIDADDPHFFPAAIEFGHRGAPAHPFMRPAIDAYRRLDVARIARRLRRMIRREGGE